MISFCMSVPLQYEENRKIKDLVKFLIDILDTPEKIQLLTEIRYLWFQYQCEVTALLAGVHIRQKLNNSQTVQAVLKA